MDIDSFTESEIKSDIKRIKATLESNIFAPENSGHPLLEASFTELIVCLNDLLQKAKDLGVPVTFSDDIVKMDKVNDITDTVSKIRNAVCHISSPLRFHTKTEQQMINISFVVLYGKVSFAKIDEIEIRSDFADDVCFMYGAFKLYLNRHIIRAYVEACQKVLPLLSNNS